MPYKVFEPDEKVSSPKSTRDTLKIKNDASSSGKYSIKIGSASTEQENISSHGKKEYDVTDQAFVLINKGKVDLEWLRD